MEHEDGTGSVFPITAALERDLALVPVGARLRIVYVGMKKSRTGRMFRAFQVFVEDGPADEGHAPQPAPKMKGKKLSSRNEPWPPPDTEDGDVVPF